MQVGAWSRHSACRLLVMLRDLPSTLAFLLEGYGWPQSLGHEMGQVRCIDAESVGSTGSS